MSSESSADKFTSHTSSLDANLLKLLQHSRTRVIFGVSTLDTLGEAAKHEGAKRVLLVTDPGIVRAGHVERAQRSLEQAGVEVFVFDGVEENPSTDHVTSGVEFARQHKIDFIVGLGGGSSMDCAKGINFLLTNGGQVSDYWGIGKAEKPMLPMIAIPTTAGTGSEAQSFALICDAVTRRKMACGDVKATCRVAILDPDLTATQPAMVAAATGIDAIAHAVETAGTTKQNEISRAFSFEAWKRLSRSFERAIQNPNDDLARADMLLGAHLAGAAIEQSMLGAAHACANPLTARKNITHGFAVGVMLPHVVRYNASHIDNPYQSLGMAADDLADRVEFFLEAGGLKKRLNEYGVCESDLPTLAGEATQQWTAGFNPCPVGPAELLEIYQAAFA